MPYCANGADPPSAHSPYQQSRSDNRQTGDTSHVLNTRAQGGYGHGHDDEQCAEVEESANYRKRERSVVRLRARYHQQDQRKVLVVGLRRSQCLLERRGWRENGKG